MKAWLILVTIYICFFFWYTDTGGKLSEDEIQDFLVKYDQNLRNFGQKFLHLIKIEILMPHLCLGQGTPQRSLFSPAALTLLGNAISLGGAAAGSCFCGVPCSKHRCGTRISIFVKYKNFCPKVLIF